MRTNPRHAWSQAIATDDDEQNNIWQLGVWGAGYCLVGFGTLHASRHLGNPFHFVLTALGLLLAAAGAWCLLWFVGIAALVGLAETKHGAGALRVLIVGVLLLAFGVDWWFFLR